MNTLEMNETIGSLSTHTEDIFLNKIKKFKLKNTTKKKRMSINGVEQQNGEDRGGRREFTAGTMEMARSEQPGESEGGKRMS